MNRQTRYVIGLMLLMALVNIPNGVNAQQSHMQDIRFEQTQGLRKGEQVAILSELKLDGMKLRTQDLVILVPKLLSRDGQNEMSLSPLFVVGKTRAKVIERERRFGHQRDYMVQEPLSITTRQNGTAQSVQYSTHVAYEAWMDDATLSMEEWVIGCAECEKGRNHQVVSQRILTPIFLPQYRLLYIVPAVEPVKNRADRYVATVNFPVDKDNLDLSYRNNRAVLNEIEDKVAKVVHNEDLQVGDIEIAGYASPEASVAYNKSLSQRRAKAIANYLSSRFDVTKQMIKVVGYGEDWGMVRDEVAKSALADKEQVLQIIDTTPDLDARDAKLIQLSGGTTYQAMLREIYPRIRRTEYTLSYVVRGFDVEEAKQVIRTNPKLLSLNEMYQVAKSYPTESKEFKEVFDIATRLYPNEPVAIVNASAADIEGGNCQAAIERLSRIKEDSRAWNNLAVAYALAGDYQRAQEYFSKASQAGDSQAAHNINELHKLLKQKGGE